MHPLALDLKPHFAPRLAKVAAAIGTTGMAFGRDWTKYRKTLNAQQYYTPGFLV